MGLKISLAPGEKILINGCEITNGNARTTLSIDNFADVVRAADLISEADAVTLISKTYFMLQTMLIHSQLRSAVVPDVQKNLAVAAATLPGSATASIFEAANLVSSEDFYKAMKCLKPLMNEGY